MLHYCFCLMFWLLGREACGILAPWPGVEPESLTWEGKVLTTGPTGKSRLSWFHIQGNWGWERINLPKLELWCWRRLLRVPWTARRSNQFILKEISPEYSSEGLMLRLKLQYFDHLMKNWLIGKDPDTGKDWRQEEKGTAEDKMVGWHHWLNGHEFEQALGVGEGQGSLVCCSPWGLKESDMTEWLNRTDW